MRTIHDDAGNNLLHVGNVAEVNGQIVIAIHVATLGQPHFLGSCLKTFFHGILHVRTAKELGFLDVHRLTGFHRSQQKVGLPTKECRNLQYIHHLSCRSGLIALMDVGKQRQAIACLDVGQHLQAFFKTRTTERMDAGTVGLVKRRLEINGNAKLLLYVYKLLRHSIHHIHGLNHTGAGYKDWLHNSEYVFYILPQSYKKTTKLYPFVRKFSNFAQQSLHKHLFFMSKVVINCFEDFEPYAGKELGTSDYVQLTQERICQFADATLDHQWIHVDEEKAKAESPFGTTIAHGYLTLSMLPYLWDQIIEVNNLERMMNYGMDKMKFNQPVLSGQHIRMKTKLEELANLRGAIKTTIKFTIEIQETGKKALEGLATFIYYFKQ